MRLTAMRQVSRAKPTRKAKRSDVDRLEAEGAAADQFDQLVQGVDLGHHLHALRQAFDREEGAGDEEERRDAERGDVVELVDLGHGRRHRDAEAGEAERGDEAEERHQQHPPGRVEAEGDRDEQREAAVEAGAKPIQSISAVTSSSTSTGAARIAS